MKDDELKGYPKLQWSVFVKNGKDTQYVVRAETEEEFKKLKTFVLAQVAEDLIAAGANVKVEPGVTAKTIACEKCGEPAEEKRGTSKAGKAYHGIFCSGDKTHVKWMAA